MQNESISLATLEGAKQYLEVVFESARENFNEYGYCIPVALVFATRTPEGQQLAEPAVYIIGAEDEAFKSANGKDLYAAMLKKVVRSSCAVGIAMVQEAWMAEGKTSDEDMKRVLNREVSVRSLPTRKEVVFVTLEHAKASGPICYCAEITRDSEGKGTLGKFEPFMGSDSSNGSAKMEGRFSGFLTHIN